MSGSQLLAPVIIDLFRRGLFHAASL